MRPDPRPLREPDRGPAPPGRVLDAAAPVLVRLEQVRKSYGAVEVLKGIDLAVANGELVTVVGPSGSGKTTVLRLIGGFTEPTSGRIMMEGTDISKLPAYRRPFNTVFQDYALFPHLTVAENVAYGLTVRRLRRGEIRARTALALERVALPDLGPRYPAQLSGGQRQRVALARAIVCEPRLVLLDEPLGALDAGLRRQMQVFLKRLQQDLKTTFLFVTHDQEEAVTMADRIVVMDHGDVVQVGAPADVYYRPRNAYVARFFGDNNMLPCEVLASGGGSTAVSTPFGPMTAARVAGAVALSPGRKAWLVVRPEAVSLSPALDMVNRARVRIADVRFAGPTTEIRFGASEEGGADSSFGLSAKLASRSGGPGVSRGDPCVIGWSETACSLVARDDC